MQETVLIVAGFLLGILIIIIAIVAILVYCNPISEIPEQDLSFDKTLVPKIGLLKAMYDFQKIRINRQYEVMNAFKTLFQYLLIALSFLSVFLALLLRIYLDTGFFIDVKHSLLVRLQVIICSLFWSAATILAIYGFVKETSWSVQYDNADEIRTDFKEEKLHEWYQGTILSHQYSIAINNMILVIYNRKFRIAAFATVSTITCFLLSFLWILSIS